MWTCKAKLPYVTEIPWWAKSHWDQLDGRELTEDTETCKDRPCAHMMYWSMTKQRLGKHRNIVFSHPHSSLLLYVDQSQGIVAATCRSVIFALWRCSACPVSLSKFRRKGLASSFAQMLHKWTIKTLTVFANIWSVVAQRFIMQKQCKHTEMLIIHPWSVLQLLHSHNAALPRNKMEGRSLEEDALFSEVAKIFTLHYIYK